MILTSEALVFRYCLLHLKKCIIQLGEHLLLKHCRHLEVRRGLQHSRLSLGFLFLVPFEMTLLVQVLKHMISVVLIGGEA